MKDERLRIVLRNKDMEEFKKLKELYPEDANTDIVRKLMSYYKATSPAYNIITNAQKLKIELDEIQLRTERRKELEEYRKDSTGVMG